MSFKEMNIFQIFLKLLKIVIMEKLKNKNMIQALAVTNEQDILAIYNVVSPELQAQIKQAYPHLFKPKQFDFSESDGALMRLDVPFFVGKGLCDDKEDMNKCLIVYSCYYAEIDETSTGYQLIRFFRK